jgi:hypothetical protein
MKIHRLSEEELAERDEKICRMANMGCLQADIGRRYGLAPKSVRGAIRRCREKGIYVKDWSRNPHDWGRAGYLDGVAG